MQWTHSGFTAGGSGGEAPQAYLQDIETTHV